MPLAVRPSANGGLNGVDVAVLAGGLGTRIKAVLGDVPKILAPIGEQPFLDYLLAWLNIHGATRVVLSLGHLADRVVDHLERSPPQGIEVVPMIEPAPLGTGGAIRHIRPQLHSDPVFVINGDTFLDADISGFVARHRAANSDISLLCAKVNSVARFGSVEINDAGYVRAFIEKDASRDGPGLISGGMYLFSAFALDELLGSPGASLERDFLQAQPSGTIRSEMAHGHFVDIGTPESLAQTTRALPDHLSELLVP